MCNTTTELRDVSDKQHCNLPGDVVPSFTVEDRVQFQESERENSVGQIDTGICILLSTSFYDI